MDALIFAQTIFYLISSLFIIVLLIFTALASYYLIHIAKNLNKLSNDLNQASEKVREDIKEIIERLSSLPLLSFFLKKLKNKTVSKKGRIK